MEDVKRQLVGRGLFGTLGFGPRISLQLSTRRDRLKPRLEVEVVMVYKRLAGYLREHGVEVAEFYSHTDTCALACVGVVLALRTRGLGEIPAADLGFMV